MVAHINSPNTRVSVPTEEWNKLYAEIKKLESRIETLCWRCSHSYPMSAANCPECGAINANIDLMGAMKQEQDSQ